MSTPQQELALVKTSIARILNSGQRTKLPNGTEVQHADLEKLLARQRQLESEVTPEQSGQTIEFVTVGLGRVP